MSGGTDISNRILAADPSRVSIRRKAIADIGALRSLMKTYRPGFCSRWLPCRSRYSLMCKSQDASRAPSILVGADFRACCSEAEYQQSSTTKTMAGPRRARKGGV